MKKEKNLVIWLHIISWILWAYIIFVVGVYISLILLVLNAVGKGGVI